MSSDPIHTRNGKRAFIRDLCGRIKREALSKVDQMPEQWDGHELRAYLADKFQDSASMSLIVREPKSRRTKNYLNTIYTTTL